MTTQRFGFSCTIKLIIFFILIPSYVYSGLHTLMTTYTGVHGQAAVTTLDGHQIDLYDSNVKKLWTEYTEIREKQHRIYRDNIRVLMETLNQAHGDHKFQRIYGCVWDDETGEYQGFDQYTYDGEDFISLDLEENKYIASVQQAKPIVKKWNKDTAQLKYLKRYYELECVYWLKEFLHSSKAAETPSLPEIIQNILTEIQNTPSEASNNFNLPVIIPVTATVIPIVLLGVAGLCIWLHRKELKAWYKKKTNQNQRYKKKTIKSKTEPSPDPAPAVESLL